MDTNQAELCWLIRTQPRQPKGVRRFQSGMVGVATGQTARLNVVSTAESGAQAWPVRVLYALTGNPRSEVVAQSSVILEPGVSAFLDAPFEKCGAAGEKRHQIRAAVTVLDDADCRCVVTLEVFDNRTGRTVIVVQVPELW